MLSFYKFCISRGVVMGNLLFIGVYSYIAGIVLLYQIGGSEYVTFQPHIVWQSLYYQWGAYQTQTGGDLGFKFMIALLSPLFIGTAIKLFFKIVSYPMKQRRKRREAMQPRPKTAEERIEELETKLSEIEGKNTAKEELEEQESTQDDDNISLAKAPEISTSPAKEMESTTPSSASISNDEVIITPPPRMYDTEEDGAPQEPISQTYHPQSVDADFLKNRNTDKKENDV